MILWFWILLSGGISFATKLAGYLVPARILGSPRMLRVAAALTVGLLTSLTVVTTLATGTALVPDARLAAAGAAALALWLRAPFLVVVAAGALAAAVARLAGMP